MRFLIESGTTCLAISKRDWDLSSSDGLVLHHIKNTQLFQVEHILCDPHHPETAGNWRQYALAGWWGFLRSGAWVLLVKPEDLKIE
jgi:hypothetical protein